MSQNHDESILLFTSMVRKPNWLQMQPHCRIYRIAKPRRDDRGPTKQQRRQNTPSQKQ